MPPTRFRVVERGRRLEVIDSWAGERPATPRPERPVTSRSARHVELYESDSPARVLAKLACGGASDAEGRPIFTTAPWFDRRAPRTIALEPGGVRWLGAAIVVAMMLTALVIVLGIAGLPFAAAVTIGVIGLANQHGRKLGTRWVDALERANR